MPLIEKKAIEDSKSIKEEQMLENASQILK
jgi:hypothetical protein